MYSLCLEHCTYHKALLKCQQCCDSQNWMNNVIQLTLECIGLPRWSYLSYHGGNQAGADADTSGAQWPQGLWRHVTAWLHPLSRFLGDWWPQRLKVTWQCGYTPPFWGFGGLIPWELLCDSWAWIPPAWTVTSWRWRSTKCTISWRGWSMGWKEGQPKVHTQLLEFVQLHP